MSKIYIAGRYGRREELALEARKLRALGHEVTSRWLDGNHEELPPRTCAEDDLADVLSADTLIAFTDPEGSLQTGGARHVEFGLALATDLRLIIIGEREVVFHHLDGIQRYDSVEEIVW